MRKVAAVVEKVLMSKIVNFFEVFDIEVAAKIDLSELEKKYFQFQLQFHPDNSNKDEIEKSILINQAYKILSDDLSRLIHILQLDNVDLQDDEKMVKTDSETLLEILNLQEEIAEADDQKKQNIKKNIKEKFKNLIDLAAEKISENIKNKISEKNHQADSIKIAQILIKAKYFDKILQDLKK
jgi:Fe-S protein assembly co-chaperone HscB